MGRTAAASFLQRAATHTPYDTTKPPLRRMMGGPIQRVCAASTIDTKTAPAMRLRNDTEFARPCVALLSCLEPLEATSTDISGNLCSVSVSTSTAFRFPITSFHADSIIQPRQPQESPPL